MLGLEMKIESHLASWVEKKIGKIESTREHTQKLSKRTKIRLKMKDGGSGEKTDTTAMPTIKNKKRKLEKE